MSLELNAQETIVSGVRRILFERIDASIALLKDPGEDFDGSVHEARKNCKRIRAVLRLVRDEIGDDVYRRENWAIRDTSRMLAPMRDSWVMVETLDIVKKHYKRGLADDAFKSIRQKLVVQYEEKRALFLSDPTILPAAMAEFEAAREQMAALPLKNDDFSAVSSGLRRVYQRGRRGLKAAYQYHDDPEVFHDWRKRVKYLWHQFEVLTIMWPSYMSEVANELHKLSKYLGDAHDLVVLKETLESQPELFGDEPQMVILIPLIDRLQMDLEAAARPLGERMYVDSPAVFVRRLATYWEVWQTDQFNGVPAKKAPPSNGNFVSTRDAAAKLGVSVKEVRERIKDGKLTAVKVGNVWAIPEGEL